MRVSRTRGTNNPNANKALRIEMKSQMRYRDRAVQLMGGFDSVTSAETPFLLGWEEWLSLPDLGLPAIKAKIDTGARTSSLHAFLVETFGPADKPRVRFAVHPVPGRDDIQVSCVADIIDRREVTSSNGESELRYVIRTDARMGDRTWPIELALANRETLAYRMLLGRQAIQDGMLVDPAGSFHQPRLSYGLYQAATRTAASLRPLHIGLMTRRPEIPSNRRLVRTAEARGHHVTILDRSRLSLFIAPREPALYVDGRPMTDLDAVVVRSGRALGSFSQAAVRMCETLGAYAINPADALARLADPLARRLVMARAGVPVPEAVVNHSDLLKATRRDEPVLADSVGLLGRGRLTRLAIVGNRCLAALIRPEAGPLDDAEGWQPASADIPEARPMRVAAEQAAAALGLGLCVVDVVETRQGPLVVGISTNVSIAQFDRIAQTSLAEAIVVHLEMAARMRAVRVEG